MNFYKVTCPGCCDSFISNRSHREYCGPRCAMRVRRQKAKGQLMLVPGKSEIVEATVEQVVRYAEFDQKRKAGSL